MRQQAVFAVIAALGLIAFAPARAETVAYKTDLSAAHEVPPNSSKGTGHLAATYDTTTKTLSWKVDYKDLTGPAAAAHFHGPAPLGKNAGVMIPISGSLASPIQGSATLTEAQAKALAAGELYFNIHTAANKGGEIRGQVTKGM